jgi:hypothetical protein
MKLSISIINKSLMQIDESSRKLEGMSFEEENRPKDVYDIDDRMQRGSGS